MSRASELMTIKLWFIEALVWLRTWLHCYVAENRPRVEYVLSRDWILFKCPCGFFDRAAHADGPRHPHESCPMFQRYL